MNKKSKSKVDTLANGAVKANTEAIAANTGDINTIKANYARVDDNKLVYGQGADVMTIIFDCGGAE